MNGLFRKLLSFSFLAFTYLPAQSQTAGGFATATLSEVFPVSRDCSGGIVVADTGGYLYMTQEDDKKFYFTKLDADLKVGRNTESDIKEEYQKLNEGTVKVVQAGERTWWFYNLYDKKEKTDMVYCREFSASRGGFIGGRKLAIRSNMSRSPTHMGFSYGNNNPVWNVAASPDGSKIVVDIDEWDKKVEPRGPAYNNVRIFDGDMKPLWSRKLSLETGLEVKFITRSNEMTNSRQTHIWDEFQVDNEGSIYAVGKFPDEEVESSKIPAFSFHFSKWTQDTKEPIQLSFRLGEKYSSEYRLLLDGNNNLTFVGFYSGTKGLFSKLSFSAGGIAAIQVKEEGGAFKTQYTSMLPFPASAMASYEKERIQRKVERAEDKGKEVELGNLGMNAVNVSPDGSLDVDMEQLAIITTTTYTGPKGGSYSRTSYNYGDGYVMRINPEGLMSWMTKIPKQNGPVDQTLSFRTFGTISYKSISYNKNTYIVFMDNYNNKSLQPGEAPRRFDEGDAGNLIALKVTPDGKIYKQILLDVGKDLDLSLHNSFLLGKNKLVVRGKIDKKTEQICVIEFN